MQTASAAKLRLRTDAVRGAMASRGITSLDALADRLSLSRATVVRIMSGKHEPSSAFIAGVHTRLGVPFDLIIDAIDNQPLTARRAS